MIYKLIDEILAKVASVVRKLQLQSSSALVYFKDKF